MGLQTWLGTDPYSDVNEVIQQKAMIAWRTINDDPRSIVFKNSAGTSIAAQTVRIESDNRAAFPISASGTAPRRQVIIFGIKGHPTLPNTDIREGYTFNLDSDKYFVKDVITTIQGEIQAIAEATR